jgi:hypothetical protein
MRHPLLSEEHSPEEEIARRMAEIKNGQATGSLSRPVAAQTILGLSGTGLWEGDLSEMREDLAPRREP